MKLKTGLLYMILENSNTTNKYSRAYINLKNVIELEKRDNFKFSAEILTKFESIKKSYNFFINEIPLTVIELYYFKNINNLDDFVYLEYNGLEVSDLKVLDLNIKLEEFYNKIFSLACEIASYYNLEIKLNKSNDNLDFI